MSRSRKHITNDLINSYPEPKPTESIVRVVSTRGTNQVEGEYPNKEKILVMMPAKFKKLVWTKKGDYLIIATDRSEHNKGKIKGIIEYILLPHQIKHLKKIGVWPAEFVEKTPDVRIQSSADGVDDNQQQNGNDSIGIEDKDQQQNGTASTQHDDNGEENGADGSSNDEDDESYDDDESDDDEIYENPNRIAYSDSDDDDDDEEDEDEEDDE